MTIYHKNQCWRSILRLIAVSKMTNLNIEKKQALLHMVIINVFNETINLKYISNDNKIYNIFILFRGYFSEEELKIKEVITVSTISDIKKEKYKNLSSDINLKIFWFKFFNCLDESDENILPENLNFIKE